MFRSVRIGSAALSALVLFTLTPAWALEEVDHVDHEHRAVRISSARLHPEVQRIGKDDALAWVNYTRQVARVSFDESVATKLACRSRSSFTLDGGRLVSNRIQGKQFASLCLLAPGEYPYRVELSEGSGQGGIGVPRKLEGRIVVTP